MKNKRLVYLLLPVVVLVWGLIGWRIWAAASEPASAAGPSASPRPAKLGLVATRPPRLLLRYGDPFGPVGGGRPEGAVRPAPVAGYAGSLPPAVPAPAAHLAFPVRPASPPAVVAAAEPWPQVEYLGAITHANGQAQVALLRIDKEEVIVKVGQRARDIQVLHLFRDSVQVAYRNQKRSFQRSME